MKNLLIFFAIVVVSFGFSVESDPLREPSEIKIGKLTLDTFIKIHNSGLKTDTIDGRDSSQKIKDNLVKYLKTKNLDIDYLKEADLTNANMKSLDLRYLNLKEANLTNADLTNTNLEGANLKEAKVTNAKFFNSNLTNVDIHEAKDLSISQLLTCKSLYKTKLPEGYTILVKKEKPNLLKKK
jgi:hypothetical protein